PAELVQISSDGNTVLYQDQKSYEYPWRKKHQSAAARDIWAYDKARDSHRMLTTFAGEDRNPVFTPDGKAMYYLSEEGGSFNVFKMNLTSPDGDSEKSQVTQLEDFPVRFLSISREGLMAFSYDGELYTFREGASPQKVEVEIRTQAATNPDSYIGINGGVSEMSISPNGKEIAFTARGEVFVTTVDGAITKRITNTPERDRFLQFAPDGKSIVYAAERDGKWQIFRSSKVRENEEPFFYASTLIKEEELVSNDFDNYQPKLSPDGEKLAYIEDRRTLKVMDMKSKKTETLLTRNEMLHMGDGDQYFTWSPDSKWLLAEYHVTLMNNEVVLLDATGERPMLNLTRSGYGDGRPTWVNEGKQMLWFSNRDGLKSFATSGGGQVDVYALFFSKEAFDKYRLSEDDYKLMKAVEEAGKSEKEKAKEEKEEKKKEEDKKVESISIDWEGIHDRKARLSIHSAEISDAVLDKDAEVLYYLASFEAGINLWTTNLRTKETKKVLELDANYGSLRWDKDMENLYLLADGSISKITEDGSKKDPIEIAGEMTIDTDAELRYMFEHVENRTKGAFYTPDMHGVNWDTLTAQYARYLPSIGNGYEFAEMLSEMLGELNLSHAGADYSRKVEQADATASLGIFVDYTHEGPGIKIAEVMKGGPLDKAHLSVESGQIIQKIDGEPIAGERDLAAYLNRKADKFTLLEITDSRGKKAEQITVKPIGSGAENRLRYKRWVDRNQQEVDSLSGGKLGYVHIPGMSDGPYRNIYEEMMGKYHDRAGVVVDTRFNGGGDLVGDLAMFFSGEKFITYETADFVAGYEPTFRWTKPTLVLFNEGNYSDGHCFACGYTDLEIGKTVGMPVPGTCSWAGWEGLPNGGSWGMVPLSAKDKSGNWMENNETKPQFLVKNMPGKIDKGVDEQLLKAVEELLKDVE
ncbi:MAG: S41 family peptidase, partial [Cryomorphaceae bacterium]